MTELNYNVSAVEKTMRIIVECSPKLHVVNDIVAKCEAAKGRKLEGDEWLLVVRLMARAVMTPGEKFRDGFAALGRTMKGYQVHAGPDYLPIIRDRWERSSTY
jgi:hypothetical protein